MSFYRPDDFGDRGLRHEVNVFVYRLEQAAPEYLLLRATPRLEQSWRPVVGAVDWDEDLRHAALRQARAETGLLRAWDLVAPAPGLVEEVGDLRLIEWPFGLQAAPGWHGPRDGRGDAAFDWCGFEQALDVLGRSLHRQNLLQLHLRLAA